MKIDRKALKSAARLALRRHTGQSPWQVTALYLLLTGGLSLVLGLVTDDPISRLVWLLQQGIEPGQALGLAVSTVGTVGLFANILLLLIRLVLDLGYMSWGLQVSRGKQTGASALTDGFALVGRVLLLNAAVALLSHCWYVVIFVPLITLLVPVAFLPGGAVLMPLVLIGGLALFALCVLRYAMADFCLLDEPEQGVFHALRTSRLLLRGRVIEYALLLLSFFGWYVLGVAASWIVESAAITVLGGMDIILRQDMQAVLELSGHPVVVILTALAGWAVSLWLQPYVTLTQAGWYDRVREQAKQE